MYGAESDLYQLFDTLKQTASNKELVHLIDHKNTVLNGYSVWGLVDNKYNGLEYIFKRVLKSNKTLYTISFDVGSEEHLSHLLYSRLKSSLLSTDSIDSTYYLNKISIIDSLILYSNHLPGYYDREYGSYLRNSSLSNNDQDPETYNRVKYLALKEKEKFNNFLKLFSAFEDEEPEPKNIREERDIPVDTIDSILKLE